MKHFFTFPRIAQALRQLWAYRSYGYSGIQEITGSTAETDICATIWDQHGYRLQSALALLTLREEHTTLLSVEEKKALRRGTTLVLEFLEECARDAAHRHGDDALFLAQLAANAEDHIHRKIAGKAVSF